MDGLLRSQIRGCVMPVTKDQADMLAALAVAARPTGARRWDAPGVVAAIGKVKHLHLVDVMRAVANAADDRDLETPGAIGNPQAPCWRNRTPDRPEPKVASIGPWCQTCGVAQSKHAAQDHPFDPKHEKRDAETVHRITQSLKAEIKPLTEPAEPADRSPSTPRPELEEARAALGAANEETAERTEDVDQSIEGGQP